MKFLCVFRWLSGLEKGKFGKKYKLKVTTFKGGALKTVRDYPFVITQILENFIKDDEDQQIIIKHVKNLVKKDKKSKKQKKSSSDDDDDDDDDSNSNSKSDSENVDVWR